MPVAWCWGNPLKALTAHGKITGVTDPRIIAIVLCAVMVVLYSILH